MGKETRALKDAYERLRMSVVEALADRNLAKVARNIGLHENTIRSIANGKNKKPAIETLETLADYLFGGGK
jgi:transcriptional regulator with XRE-family HTH domain